MTVRSARKNWTGVVRVNLRNEVEEIYSAVLEKTGSNKIIMIILSNCLSDKTDEGTLKIVKNLTQRIKKYDPETKVVTYERCSALTDIYVHIPNIFRKAKLMISGQLHRVLKDLRTNVLFIPPPAKMISNALRTFTLSIFARWGLCVIMVMQLPICSLSKMLFRMSGATIITLSQDAASYYRRVLANNVIYIKAGVDTTKFKAVSREKKLALRKKYGLPTDKPIVVHAGHLKKGRNIGQLLKIDERFHIVMVASTLMADEQDRKLRAELEAKPNLTLIDTYLPHIEEVYQLADVYFFPVQNAGNCVDIPLSVMEAAACQLAVVCTPYGELKEIMQWPGFFEITTFDETEINNQLHEAVQCNFNVRNAVLQYDWENAVQTLLNLKM